MSVIVQLTVTAKPDKYQELYDTFVAILPDTAARDGAQLISAGADPATNSFRIWEVWDKIEDQKSYLKWRAERGDLDKLGAMLAGPPAFDELEHLTF